MTNQELKEILQQLNDAISKISCITKEQCNYQDMRNDYARLIGCLKKILEWGDLTPEHETMVKIWLQVLDREQYRIEE